MAKRHEGCLPHGVILQSVWPMSITVSFVRVFTESARSQRAPAARGIKVGPLVHRSRRACVDLGPL